MSNPHLHAFELTMKSGLPLESGLRALAQNSTHAATRTSLNHLAAELEKGKRMQDVLANISLPPVLKGVLQAGYQVGHPEVALTSYQEAIAHTQAEWSQIRYLLAQLCLYVVFILVIVFIAFEFILPTYALIFEHETSYTPSAVTFTIMWLNYHYHFIHEYLRELIPGGLYALLALFVAICYLALNFLGGYTVLGWVPWLGQIIKDQALSRIMRMMALLIKYERPMPEAIQLVRDQTHDPLMKWELSKLLKAVETQRPLEDYDSRLPAELRQTFANKGTGTQLQRQFETWAEALESESVNSLQWLCRMMEPVLYVLTVIIITLLFGTLSSELKSIIKYLT
jgi:type II secretory pathway component PulF